MEIKLAEYIERSKCKFVLRYSKENERKMHCWDTVTETELTRVSNMIIDNLAKTCKDDEVAKLIKCYKYDSKLQYDHL